MKKIWMILYCLLVAWLPESRHLKFAKKSREWFAKKILLRAGNNINIERYAKFSDSVSIGNNSGIGIKCELYGEVSIGNNVLMGPEVIVYTNGHKFDSLDIPIINQGYTEMRPVVIGDNVWIGRRVIILPGVHIGSGCVIGAGAVVSKDLPSNTVCAGIPAKVVKNRG